MRNSTQKVGRRLNPLRRIAMVFAFLLVVGSVQAGHSQNGSVISIDARGATLKTVFEQIEEQSEFILYYTDKISSNHAVNLNMQDATVEQILEAALPADHNYRINGRQIVIDLDQQPAAQGIQYTTINGKVVDAQGIPIIGVNVVISGTVFGTTTDINGDYTLRVPVGAEDMVVAYSFIGFRRQEIPYSGQPVINITLQEDQTMVGQVVVTGMVNINRPDMVGAYTQIRADSIFNPSMTTIDQMLAGQVAGLDIAMPSLRAGASPQVTLRGQGTLLGTTQPLWVVDGIVQSDVTPLEGASDVWNTGTTIDLNNYIGNSISWLNPQDIETITVLKDASATAIYGSRASNGVIVITTKKGTISDRISVGVTANFTVGQRPNYGLYNLMNSQEKVRFSRQALEQGAYYQFEPLAQDYTYEGLRRKFNNGAITNDYFVEQARYLETVNTDWFKELTRFNLTQTYNVSINSGTEKVTFNASASYTKQQGVEKGNDMETMSARLGMNIRFNPKMLLAVSMVGTFSETDTFYGGVNPLSYATTTSRAIPLYNQDGSLAYYQRDAEYRYNDDLSRNGLSYNILNDLANTGSNIQSPTLDATLNFQYDINNNFKLELVGGMKYNSRKIKSHMDENSYYIYSNFRGYMLDTPEALLDVNKNAAILQRGGMATTDDALLRQSVFRAQLAYRKTFNDAHRVNLNLASEVSTVKSSSVFNTVWGYDRSRGESLSPITTPENFRPIGANTTNPYEQTYLNLLSGSWRSTEFTNNKLFVALIGSYSYKDRYVLNANVRNDWSNRFGTNKNNRFQPAYSVGVAWNLLREPFMQDRALWLNDAKVRLTYGLQGNELNNMSPEAVLRMRGIHPLYGDYYSTLEDIENANLEWESTKTWNYGFDMALFDNRLTVVVDGYSRTSDAQYSRRLGADYGGFDVMFSSALIRNSGIEVALNAVPYRDANWHVSVGVNFGRNWNKVVEVRNRDLMSDQILYSDFLNGASSRMLAEGYSIGSFWAFSYAGLNPANGMPQFNYVDELNQAITDGTRVPNQIDPMEYLVSVGNKEHNFSGGFNVRVRYKEFMLSTNWQIRAGAKDFLPNPYSSFAAGRLPDPTENLSKVLNNRWRNPGDENRTNIPGLFTGANSEFLVDDPRGGGSLTYTPYQMWAQSDTWVAPAYTIRCRAISLTYDLPAIISQKADLSRVAVTAAVNNPFLFADKRWEGMDPELGGLYRTPMSFTIGLSIGF